jgi:hypothetical protein
VETDRDESLRGEGVALEDVDVEELLWRRGGGGGSETELSRRADEHVHDGFCGLLAWSQVVEVCKMSDIEVFRG